MSDMEHVGLFVEGSDGREATEVRRLADGLLEILYTPGFVEGIAAGDLIRVTDPDTGAFEVVRRGGNLGVKLFSEGPIQPVLDWLGPSLLALQARLDGQIERGAVLTIPASIGLPAVDAAMDAVATAFPGLVWYYGNVYDAAGEPLGWWLAPRG